MLTRLEQALPRSEFIEHHSLVVDAPPDRVWHALHETRWRDLRYTAVFMLIRGVARPWAGLSNVRLFDDGPVPLLYSDGARYTAGGRVAKPWLLRPVFGPDCDDLRHLARFDEPGWLKYGTDFHLVTLDSDRTRIDTATLCEPTDAIAARRFAPYWRLIRPFSGLIRRDLLRAVAARARVTPVVPTAPASPRSR